MLEFVAQKRREAEASRSPRPAASSREADPANVVFVAPRCKARSGGPPVHQEDPVLEWVRAALTRTPPGVQPRTPTIGLAEELKRAGMTGPWDLQGLTVPECVIVFPLLAGYSVEFVRSLQQAQNRPKQGAPKEHREGAQPAAQEAVPDAVVEPALAALRVLALARRDSQMLPPEVLADALLALAKLPAASLQKLNKFGQGPMPDRPADRATWLQRQAALDQSFAFQELVVREFYSWHKSAFRYVSAVRLWGRVAASVREQPWPPSEAALGAFAFAVRNGNTLMRYISSIRSVLRLTGIPLGILDDTSALSRGAVKGTEPGYKARASAKQTRDLARYVRDTLGEPLAADSFVVARHFCLRYASEVLPLSRNSAHSSVDVAESAGLPQVTLHLHSRKACRGTVAVVRRCICAKQTPELCGVCILKESVRGNLFFPGLTYSSALAALKMAALALGFPKAESWGTHAFRRGWADEALQHGGVPALFFSGGWRGVAAFGYASAQAKGELQAAEWLVEFTASSGSE